MSKTSASCLLEQDILSVLKDNSNIGVKDIQDKLRIKYSISSTSNRFSHKGIEMILRNLISVHKVSKEKKKGKIGRPTFLYSLYKLTT